MEYSRILILAVIVTYAVMVVTKAQAPTPPAALSSYVTYTEGDSNLVITVPHGGGDRPDTVSDRTVCPSADPDIEIYR